jgi:O-antigen ligase
MFIIILLTISIFPLFILSGLVVLPVAVAKVRALAAKANQLDLMWFLLFASLNLGSMRTAGELADEPVDTVRLMRISLLLVIECWIVASILIRKRPLASLFRGVHRFMVLYTIVALLSMFWSPNPGLSAWKAFEVLVDVSFICFLISTPNWKKHLAGLWNLTWFMVMLLICSVWVGVALFPSRALQVYSGALLKRQLHGAVLTLNPNSLGQMAALVSAVAIIRFLYSKKEQSRILYIWVSGFAFVTLVFSQARTSFVAFVCALGFILILSRRQALVPIAMTVIILMLLSLMALPAATEALYSYLIRGQNAELLFSLSGRTYYWGLAWELVKQAPMQGYGFYAGHRADAIKGLSIYSNLDNTYIEILQNIGILGLLPILLAFTITWKRILKFLIASYHKRRCCNSLAVELFAVLFIITIRSITGPSFQNHHWNLLFFLLILAWGECIKKMSKAGIKVGWLSHAHPALATNC